MKKNHHDPNSFLHLLLILVLMFWTLPPHAAAQQRPYGVRSAPDAMSDQAETAPDASGAAILIDQQPNGYGGIVSDAHCDYFCGLGAQVIADDFALAGAETINQIVFWGEYFPYDIPLATDDFTVIIHSDDNGKPGAAISTQTSVPSTRAQTGQIRFGVHQYIFRLTLTPVVLGPGIYWVEIFNNTALGIGDFLWETGNFDPVGGAYDLIGFDDQAPGVDWNTSRDNMSLLISSGIQDDLAVTKTVNDPTPNYGDIVTFTIGVTNIGPDDATGVEVTDLLPAGLTFAGATATQGGYNANTGLWNVGALVDGSRATLTLNATVNTLNPVINVATIPPDADPSNNTASATVTPQAADLALDKTVDNATPALGDSVTFTIKITHLDGAEVSAVRVEDQIPSGTSYTSHITTQGRYDPGTGNWHVGTLTRSDSLGHYMATLMLTVAVNTTESVTNTAFIAFANQHDPFPGNNRDAAALNAVAADLELSKKLTRVSNDDGVITATFAVTVINEGPSATDGVAVVDRLSPDMTLVGTTTSQGTVVPAPPVVTWDVGALAIGATATMTVTVTVPQDGSLLNTAEVTASSLPDPDSTPGDGLGDDAAIATAAARPVPDFVPEQGPGGVIDRGDRYTADLALTKEVTVASTATGQEATYTLAVVNRGPSPTAKVEVTDHLPACLEFVRATADKGSYEDAVWHIGTLKVGARVTLEIVARVTAACTGEVVNEAWISSSTLPDPPDPLALFEEPATVANNHAEARFTVSEGRAIPLAGTPLGLDRNYPNPFNPRTTLRFSLAEAAVVRLVVYDVLGRRVRVLVDGAREAGLHEVVFEASGLPSGLYLARLETPQGRFVQTMQLVK